MITESGTRFPERIMRQRDVGRPRQFKLNASRISRRRIVSLRSLLRINVTELPSRVGDSLTRVVPRAPWSGETLLFDLGRDFLQ